MSRFGQMYREMYKAYQAKHYQQVVEIGELTARTMPIAAQDAFYFHEMMTSCMFLLGRAEEACWHLQRALQPENLPEKVEKCWPFCSDALVWLHFFPELSDEQVFVSHCLYGRLFNHIPRYQHRRERHKQHSKIRIGYISLDFYEHIVTNFAIQLYSAYDKERFEVHLYSIGNVHNEVTDWLGAMVDGWHDFKGKTAEAVAAQIYADEIDILVDLAGHTHKGHTLQVMAYKPAPVQISGIGYFNTTGLKEVDYYLTDGYCDPPGNEALFTEQLVRLPHSHFCFTPSEDVLNCKKKWGLHKPRVFGSFSNFFKLNDYTLKLWLRIIRSVPGSSLLLKNVRPDLDEIDKMGERMLALGYRQEEFELRPGSKVYLDEYNDMDIALDPYPYPGGGTTCEAIYMGVPVVTRYGTRHGSRFGYSLLCNMGVEELAAANEEDYVKIAVNLANSPELLRELHANLREIMQNSHVMDGANYVAEVQQAYADIYLAWLREEKE